MKKVENYLETLKLKKCLFGRIAPKQIEIVIQEICMLYDLELYNKNNELEQERKKNEQQDIRMEKVAEYVRQVLETLRSQIQETNHQLNQSSSAYSVLGRKMEEMELLFASSAYQRSHVFKCRRRKKRVVLRKGYQSEFYMFSFASGHMAVVFLGCDPAIY